MCLAHDWRGCRACSSCSIWSVVKAARAARTAARAATTAMARHPPRRCSTWYLRRSRCRHSGRKM
eukprot:scaffold8923_cov67-Phaeocystis_antarctica.AAC.9